MAMINKEEYEILKGLSNQWKWIARDSNTSLWVYEKEPIKHADFWDEGTGGCGIAAINLFQFIQWEDEDPYNIAWLLGEYEEAEYGYFNNELYERFYDESVEAEVKNIEWLEGEVDKIVGEYQSENIFANYTRYMISDIKDAISQLDEPEVLSQEFPVIPKFVADWIEERKSIADHWFEALEDLAVDEHSGFLSDEGLEVHEWVVNNPDIYVDAYRLGHEVEEQKYYVVRSEGLDGVHYYFTKFDDEMNGLFTLPNDKKEAYRFEDKEKAQAIANYTDSEVEETE